MADVRAKALTDEEVHRLVEVPKKVAGRSWAGRCAGRKAYRDYALFALLANTGLRTSEALLLRRQDLDVPGARIRIQTIKRGKPEMAWVKIPQGLARPLRDAWSVAGEPPKGPYLFSISSRRARAIFERWARICKIRPGISLHGFRHALALRMVRAGKSTAEIRAVLRHRKLSSTQIYVDAVEADEALDGMEPIL